MFSLYPTAYPQHRPSYYSDHDYAYLDREYLHALAQQRAKERREAQYRAHLEAARRRRAYQEHLARQEAARRYNDLFFGGFDDESEYNLSQRTCSREDRDVAAKQVTEEDLIHRSEGGSTNIPINSSSQATANIELRLETEITSPSPDPTIRDAAARKIQTFARTILPRMRALRAIATISQEFTQLQETFGFPAMLDFDTTSPTPSLLFTPRNAPLHGHEHALVKLLSSLDAVESNGDPRVRAERKQLVKRIENSLAELDVQKETIWREVIGKGVEELNTSATGSNNIVEPTTAARESDQVDMDLDTSLLDLCEDENAVEKEISVVPGDDVSGEDFLSEVIAQ